MTVTDKVRLLIEDRADERHFTDADLNSFLEMASSSIFLAAAMALESWAASEATAIDTEKIGDYSYSRKSVSNKLTLAARYRDQAAEMSAAGDNAPAFGWASMRLTRGNRGL